MPDPVTGPWSIEMQFDSDELGAPSQLVGVTVRRVEGATTTLTATELRRFPWTRLVRESRQERFDHDALIASLSPELNDNRMATTEKLHRRYAQAGKRGRPPIAGSRLREVAGVVRLAQERGENIQVAVSAHFEVDISTAKRYIARSRELEG